MEENIEYELIDIDFGYELPEEDFCFVGEEDLNGNKSDADKPAIEYDADGIPMGRTKEETIIRRNIIFNHIQKWRTEHQDNPRIFNDDINDYIKINQIFLIESIEHAATNYKSTKAVLKMDVIMSKASKVALTKTKEGNKNQKPFEKMMVMRYESEELGIVKMTVGIRKSTKENVEYSITVPSPGLPFIDNKVMITEKPKGKKRKKHHK